jgi:hypothetical protein
VARHHWHRGRPHSFGDGEFGSHPVGSTIVKPITGLIAPAGDDELPFTVGDLAVQ